MGARRSSLLSKNNHSWLLERKDILRKIKDQVRLYLGEEPEDLNHYAQAYKNDIVREWQPSNIQEIEVSLTQVDVVWGGDFHPFAQAQRAHLRFIRQLSSERSLVLCLECFFADDQQWVDQYLAGLLSEKKFLKKIKWEKKWGFPWAHYRPLLEYAQQKGIPVLALNEETGERNEKNLQRRDVVAAQKISQSLDQNPESLHYVIYGDLHIAQEHLPKRLLSIRGQKPYAAATLYLNSEKIYFELAEQGLENKVEVVRFNSHEYCLLSSPPWIKWQSYLMYLEENFDVDLDAEYDDEDDWDFHIDYTDHVLGLVRMLSAAIQEEISTSSLQVFSLRENRSLKTFKRRLSQNEYEIAHWLLKNDKCFYLPQVDYLYLSKSSVNHAATLAAYHVHRHMAEYDCTFWNFPDDFLRSIWIEAMAFFLSKFINPKRKAQSMSDLKKELKAFDEKDQGRDPLLLALDQKMLELLKVYSNKDRIQAYRPVHVSGFALAAKFLGEMLGERYFVAWENEKISLEEAKALLAQDLKNKNFDEFYYAQLKYLDRLET